MNINTVHLLFGHAQPVTGMNSPLIYSALMITMLLRAVPTNSKRHLSQANVKTLIHAFVTCKLDHCNSLLIGLPCYLIKRLQMVQNCAARLVVGGRKYDPVTSVYVSFIGYQSSSV